MSAILRGADLTGAYLNGADLTEAILRGAILNGVRWDATTMWPEGFTPPADSVQVDR